MMITPEAEARMVRYLLGELAPAESLQVESSYFGDDEVFEFIQALENEMVRDFVTGEMDPDLRRRFETHYQRSPELIRKIEFAAAVLSQAPSLVPAGRVNRAPVRHVDQRATGLWRLFSFRISGFQLATAAVAVMSVAVGIFFWTQILKLRSDLAQVERKNGSLAQEKSSLERALAEKPKELPLLASFVLVPGLSRSEGAAEPLVVPDAAGQVQFKMPLPSGIHYSGYQLILQKASGGQISSRDLLAVVDSGRAVIAGIPSASLKAGRYILYIQGLNEQGRYEDVQYYAFAIKR